MEQQNRFLFANRTADLIYNFKVKAIALVSFAGNWQQIGKHLGLLEEIRKQAVVKPIQLVVPIISWSRKGSITGDGLVDGNEHIHLQ